MPPQRGVNVCRFSGRVCASRSAVAVVSHERDDTGRGSRQLQEGVLEEFLGSGSL